MLHASAAPLTSREESWHDANAETNGAAKAIARRNRRRRHPNAAGLDVGATMVYAAVRAERAEQPIQSFPTFTCDLHTLADWLNACQVDTVAMESTGVYWIPVHQILEARGFEVVLVNARHVRSVPGRKSDVEDCEWLRCLHSVGFLGGVRTARSDRLTRCAWCVPCCAIATVWSRPLPAACCTCRRRSTR